jgi:radical SAM superfamily enzyme YgiQ (UPF0313 family)
MHKNALLIYFKSPDAFWGCRHVLWFLGKKAMHPPLGLMTVASLLPDKWGKRLVDLNISKLLDADLKWADIVFVSGMGITAEKKATIDIISRCKSKNLTVVGGGPLLWEDYDQFKDIDHFILNEAEITLPAFLSDIEKGKPERVYATESWAELAETPVPCWDLIRFKDYEIMDLQYGRGCPFNCEFCVLPHHFGHKVRTKSSSQVIKELETLYYKGWRGQIHFVDDNFASDKEKLRNDVLPAIIEWMREKQYPFIFSAKTSIDFADDTQLMNMMVEAGFDAVFIGIETTNIDSLKECSKVQNLNKNLNKIVIDIHGRGLRVMGGVCCRI